MANLLMENQVYWQREIRKYLITHFDMGGLKTLAFDLGIDYEELEGNKKSDFARELIRKCKQLQILNQLEVFCREDRPNIPFPLYHADSNKIQKIQVISGIQQITQSEEIVEIFKQFVETLIEQNPNYQNEYIRLLSSNMGSLNLLIAVSSSVSLKLIGVGFDKVFNHYGVMETAVTPFEELDTIEQRRWLRRYKRYPKYHLKSDIWDRVWEQLQKWYVKFGLYLAGLGFIIFVLLGLVQIFRNQIDLVVRYFVRYEEALWALGIIIFLFFIFYGSIFFIFRRRTRFQCSGQLRIVDASGEFEIDLSRFRSNKINLKRKQFKSPRIRKIVVECRDKEDFEQNKVKITVWPSKIDVPPLSFFLSPEREYNIPAINVLFQKDPSAEQIKNAPFQLINQSEVVEPSEKSDEQPQLPLEKEQPQDESAL